MMNKIICIVLYLVCFSPLYAAGNQSFQVSYQDKSISIENKKLKLIFSLKAPELAPAATAVSQWKLVNTPNKPMVLGKTSGTLRNDIYSFKNVYVDTQ